MSNKSDEGLVIIGDSQGNVVGYVEHIQSENAEEFTAELVSPQTGEYTGHKATGSTEQESTENLITTIKSDNADS